MVPTDNMDTFIAHAENHMKEKGIVGWDIRFLSVDSKGAQVSLD